jgi:hypothetical protein
VSHSVRRAGRSPRRNAVVHHLRPGGQAVPRVRTSTWKGVATPARPRPRSRGADRAGQVRGSRPGRDGRTRRPIGCGLSAIWVAAGRKSPQSATAQSSSDRQRRPAPARSASDISPSSRSRPVCALTAIWSSNTAYFRPPPPVHGAVATRLPGVDQPLRAARATCRSSAASASCSAARSAGPAKRSRVRLREAPAETSFDRDWTTAQFPTVAARPRDGPLNSRCRRFGCEPVERIEHATVAPRWRSAARGSTAAPKGSAPRASGRGGDCASACQASCASANLRGVCSRGGPSRTSITRIPAGPRMPPADSRRRAESAGPHHRRSTQALRYGCDRSG